jgi:hypothetical protein
MCAVYVGIRAGADKRKFYILSTHCAAMLKGKASKPREQEGLPPEPKSDIIANYGQQQ